MIRVLEDTNIMKVIKMNAKRKAFVASAREMYGQDRTFMDRTELLNLVRKDTSLSWPSWLVSRCKKDRGVYWLPNEHGEYGSVTLGAEDSAKVFQVAANSVTAMAPSALGVMDNQDSYVPEKHNGYVPYGNFNTVRDIIKAALFYPVFITGLSGNGKTLMVQEICARLKREYVRANITIETDEDDLIGGFRLLNGETVWHDGPVVTAMKRGALLLLDEIDLASNKIMCLQPVLEGSSIYIKKIGKWVHPAKGFNVIATANTKGQGSDDGRFIGTNVLNEAFLERFPVTIEQFYPKGKMEEKILNNEFAKHDKVETELSSNLVKWADVIRKTFYEGGCDEIISTRRLVHIVNAFAIFDNKMKAIELTVNRFDAETKESFLDLFTKIDAGADISELGQMVDDDDEESEEDTLI